MSSTLCSTPYADGSRGESLEAWPRMSHVTTRRSPLRAPTLPSHIRPLAEKPWVRSSGGRSSRSPWTS